MKKTLTFNEIIAILREISETATSFDDFMEKYSELDDLLWATHNKYIFCFDDHIYATAPNGKQYAIGFVDSFRDCKLILMNCDNDKDHDLTKYFLRVYDKYEK